MRRSLFSRGAPVLCLKRAGMTMVEVLVVISILGVLAVLVSSATRSAHERAKGVQCISNLRQLHIAMMNMAGENRGTLPLAYDSANGNAGWGWYLLDRNYLPPLPPVVNGKWAHDHPLLDPGSRADMRDSYLKGSYGINSEIVGFGYSERMAVVAISNPARKFLLFCSGLNLITSHQASHPSGNLYLPGRSANQTLTWPENIRKDAIEGRHGRKIHTVSVAGNIDSWNADALPTTPERWHPAR